jgi:hypothetical protein
VSLYEAIYVHCEVDPAVPPREHFPCILVNTSQAELLVNSLSQLSGRGIVFIVKRNLLWSSLCQGASPNRRFGCTVQPNEVSKLRGCNTTPSSTLHPPEAGASGVCSGIRHRSR